MIDSPFHFHSGLNEKHMPIAHPKAYDPKLKKGGLDNKSSQQEIAALCKLIHEEGDFQSKKLIKEKYENIETACQDLQKITYLGLRGLGLKDFPKGIFQLKNLRVLNLTANELTLLPDELVSLSQLTELYLNGNLFTELPPIILKMKSLERVHIDNNPFEKPFPRKYTSIVQQYPNGYTF